MKDAYEAYLTKKVKEGKRELNHYLKRNDANNFPSDYSDQDWTGLFESEARHGAYVDALDQYLKSKKRKAK